MLRLLLLMMVVVIVIMVTGLWQRELIDVIIVTKAAMLWVDSAGLTRVAMLLLLRGRVVHLKVDYLRHLR